jgi:cysteine-rich repeat protein
VSYLASLTFRSLDMTSSSFSRTGGALLLALAGACGHVTDEDPTPVTDDQPAADDPSDPTTQGAEFRLYTALDSGVPNNAFSDIDDAFLAANGLVGVKPGDYYFSVTYEVCPAGQNQAQFFPQQSPIPCRTFGIGANGTIERGTPTELDGESCRRNRGLDAATGGITVQLMPFERNMSECGVFAAYVIPVGATENANNAVATLFFTAPPPEALPPGPVCGNGVKEEGEHCDDGNEADHDGCSASCQHEPGCDEPAH